MCVKKHTLFVCFVLRQVSHSTGMLPIKVSQQTPGMPRLSLLSARITGMHYHTLISTWVLDI